MCFSIAVICLIVKVKEFKNHLYISMYKVSKQKHPTIGQVFGSTPTFRKPGKSFGEVIKTSAFF
ncbi:hypothetical protein BOQ62_10715 [Chryseobacterium sp. CH21]|nr:hypothetical protein BOQ62_10715 [Chryseobacterium sp. CH21]